MRSARFNRLTRLIGSALGEDSPGDSCQFVGQGAGDDIRVSPGQHGPDPFAERIRSFLDVLHQRTGILYQQPAQVFVAAFADTQQSGFAAGTVLTRHPPDGCGKRSSIGVLLRIPQFDGNPAGGDGANAGDVQEPLAAFILLKLLHDFLLDWPDRFVQRLEVGASPFHDGDQAWRQCCGLFGQYRG